MPSKDRIGGVLSAALAEIAGDRAVSAAAGLRLDADLGVDSLALLELIETLQQHLDVTVPDEDIGQVKTVGDLRTLFERLTIPQRPHADAQPDTETTP